jgi:hypothetical protein
MSIIAGLDMHRAQITFDWVDRDSGQRDLSSSVAGQARSGPLASGSKKGAPDGRLSILALRRR